MMRNFVMYFKNFRFCYVVIGSYVWDINKGVIRLKLYLGKIILIVV